jgi:hypothetical protein
MLGAMLGPIAFMVQTSRSSFELVRQSARGFDLVNQSLGIGHLAQGEATAG